MKDYSRLEDKVNIEGINILLLIKNDYYEFMSEKFKAKLDSLIESKRIAMINNGRYYRDPNIFAHGGGVLKDGKIHFYPEARDLQADEDILLKCLGILPHEIFHYFLRPKDVKLEKRIEREMAGFYTEGLVEKETRTFVRKHPEIRFEKALYGFNIKFVNMIQASLNVDKYEIIFSENDYLKNIGNYLDEYNRILQIQKDVMDSINEMIKRFSKDLRDEVYKKARRIIFEDGNDRQCVEIIAEIKNSLNAVKEKEDDFEMDR